MLRERKVSGQKPCYYTVYGKNREFIALQGMLKGSLVTNFSYVRHKSARKSDRWTYRAVMRSWYVIIQ